MEYKVSTPSIHLMFLVDKSSSMFDHAKQIESVINNCINSQKNKSSEDRLSIFTFSHDFEVVMFDQYLNDAPKFKDFEPKGTTYLYDSIATVIDGSLKATRSRPNQTPFLIILTDGSDFKSEKNTEEMVRKKIHVTEKEENWKFIYLTTEKTDYFKSKETEKGLGIKNCCLFNISDGLENALDAVVAAVDLYRKSGDVGNVDELNDLFSSSMKIDED